MNKQFVDHVKLIAPIGNSIDFLLKPLRTSELNTLMKHYGLNFDEAVLFTVIVKESLEGYSSVSFDAYVDDSKLPFASKLYLKWFSVLKQLAKKNMVVLEKKRRSNMLVPDVTIDEGVFSELILGEDLQSDVDFSNLYAILEFVDDLIERRDNEKISTDRFFSELKRTVGAIDPSIMLREILIRYTPMEQAMIFKAIIERLTGYGREDCSSFAGTIYGSLSEVARFMELIYRQSFESLKNKVLILDDDSAFQRDLSFDISDKVYYRLFAAKKNQKKKSFESSLVTYLRHARLTSTVYLDDEVEKQIKTISKSIFKKSYRDIIRRLKAANLPTGIVSLLYGYPGTGKTASVYAIAKQSGRDVLQVDISNIRDKYVGESEKRLKGIFEEYERAKEALGHVPILLFNEADALIGRRMVTADSVDVMNNSMQNILLEALENFDGIFFATTNLIDNMDDAFSRRFLYKVEFKKPSQNARRRIWKAKMPELSETQIDQVAHYDLTGGQIENVTRKFMLDTILNERPVEVAVLRELCENEAMFKNETAGKQIGFITQEPNAK